MGAGHFAPRVSAALHRATGQQEAREGARTHPRPLPEEGGEKGKFAEGGTNDAFVATAADGVQLPQMSTIGVNVLTAQLLGSPEPV